MCTVINKKNTGKFIFESALFLSAQIYSCVKQLRLETMMKTNKPIWQETKFIKKLLKWKTGNCQQPKTDIYSTVRLANGKEDKRSTSVSTSSQTSNEHGPRTIDTISTIVTYIVYNLIHMQMLFYITIPAVLRLPTVDMRTRSQLLWFKLQTSTWVQCQVIVYNVALSISLKNRV